MNLIDIKMITKEYHKQLYANKLGSLHRMDIFFERHKLPKLIQEKDRLNNFAPILNTESEDKVIAQRKLQALIALLVDSTKHFGRK